MSSPNDRWVLDKERLNIVDTLNRLPLTKCDYNRHDGELPDQIDLRKSVLVRRLFDLSDNLMGRPYMENIESLPRSIAGSFALIVLTTIEASGLDKTSGAWTPSVAENPTKGPSPRLSDLTSICLFLADFGSILHELFGDSEHVTAVIDAVKVIVFEYAEFTRQDLCREHRQAVTYDQVIGDGSAWDLSLRFGVNDVIGSGADLREMYATAAAKACRALQARARDVREFPDDHGKYTHAFAAHCDEKLGKLADEPGETVH